jgi:ribosome-associated protein
MHRAGRAAMTVTEAGLLVTARLTIPFEELSFRATTGGGPGGQHVNRSATRIELRWVPDASPALAAALAPDHRGRVLARLAHRLDPSGAMRLVAAEHRSQRRNRDAALERLSAIVRAALPDPVPRKATAPTRASVHRRLDEKKRRALRKRERGRPDHDG